VSALSDIPNAGTCATIPIPGTGAHVGAPTPAVSALSDIPNAGTCATIPIAGTNAHVGAPAVSAPLRPAEKLDTAILRTQAKAALTGLGWQPAIAQAAVAAALAVRAADATLEQVILEALRRCPVPRT
jgi:hypothetical protein